MATLTNEQLEQKKQLLAEKVKEVKTIMKELVEAGAYPLDESDLEQAAGGNAADATSGKWGGQLELMREIMAKFGSRHKLPNPNP